MGKPALTRARISDEETPSGKPFKLRPRNGGGKIRLDPAGTRHRDEFRQPGQFAGLAPLVQLRRVIGSDQVKQLGLGKASG